MVTINGGWFLGSIIVCFKILYTQCSSLFPVLGEDRTSHPPHPLALGTFLLKRLLWLQVSFELFLIHFLISFSHHFSPMKAPGRQSGPGLALFDGGCHWSEHVSLLPHCQEKRSVVTLPGGLSLPRSLTFSSQPPGTPLARCLATVEMPHDPGTERKSMVCIKIESLSNLGSLGGRSDIPVPPLTPDAERVPT